MMIDVFHAENAQVELEKIKALIALMQNATDDYARVKGPFQTGFDMICMNLATVFEMVDRLNANLTEVVDEAYRKTPGD